MSLGLNKVYLLGNLGDDPVLRWTKSGTAVLHMSIATTETYIEKGGGRREVTNWHRAVLWGRRGEAMEKFLRKGSRVMVEGNLRTSSWDDKDGTKRYRTEVNVRDIFLLSDRRAAESSSRAGQEPSPTEFNFGDHYGAAADPTTAEAAA